MAKGLSNKSRIKRKYGIIDKTKPGDYKPWIRTSDLKSGDGRRHIVIDKKTGRQVHLLSNLEKNVYQMFSDDDKTVQIYEQVPLNLKDTLKICNEYGLHHPFNLDTREYNVMTTDFVIISLKDNKEIINAYAVKMSKELDDARTLEKLKIEEKYWENKGISWCVITEEDL